jgi:hypothetical protein
LIAFFNTPRGDSKRFEILQLMANMLEWTEEQKEQVGLIRKALSSSSEDRSNKWVSGLWTPTIERPRSRLSEDVPRPIIRISEDEAPREVNDLKLVYLIKLLIHLFIFIFYTTFISHSLICGYRFYLKKQVKTINLLMIIIIILIQTK